MRRTEHGSEIILQASLNPIGFSLLCTPPILPNPPPFPERHKHTQVGLLVFFTAVQKKPTTFGQTCPSNLCRHRSTFSKSCCTSELLLCRIHPISSYTSVVVLRLKTKRWRKYVLWLQCIWATPWQLINCNWWHLAKGRKVWTSDRRGSFNSGIQLSCGSHQQLQLCCSALIEMTPRHTCLCLLLALICLSPEGTQGLQSSARVLIWRN